MDLAERRREPLQHLLDLSWIDQHVTQIAELGFLTIAFAGIFSTGDLAQAILSQWLFKVAYEALATPLTYLVVNALEGKHDTLSCHSCHPFVLKTQTQELIAWMTARPDKVPPHGKVPRKICEQCHVQGEAKKYWQRIATTEACPKGTPVPELKVPGPGQRHWYKTRWSADAYFLPAGTVASGQ